MNCGLQQVSYPGGPHSTCIIWKGPKGGQGDNSSRVLDQNGIWQACYIVKIYHSDPKPSNYAPCNKILCYLWYVMSFATCRVNKKGNLKKEELDFGGVAIFCLFVFMSICIVFMCLFACGCASWVGCCTKRRALLFLSKHAFCADDAGGEQACACQDPSSLWGPDGTASGQSGWHHWAWADHPFMELHPDRWLHPPCVRRAWWTGTADGPCPWCDRVPHWRHPEGHGQHKAVWAAWGWAMDCGQVSGEHPGLSEFLFVFCVWGSFLCISVSEQWLLLRNT